MLVGEVPDGMHAIIAIGAVGDQLEVVLDPNHRSRVAGQDDNVERTEDRVDDPISRAP
jgi:hypothetical protein